MKILRRTEQTVRIVETRVQDDNVVYFVKEYYDTSDEIINTTIHTKNGYIVDDPEECDKVLEFIDSVGFL